MTKPNKTHYAPQVPARLQLDGWWLDHDIRPFAKSIAPAKPQPIASAA